MGNVFRRAVQMCCTDRLCRWKIRARRQRIRAEPPVMTALSSARCNEQIQGLLRCPPPPAATQQEERGRSYLTATVLLFVQHWSFSGTRQWTGPHCVTASVSGRDSLTHVKNDSPTNWTLHTYIHKTSQFEHRHQEVQPTDSLHAHYSPSHSLRSADNRTHLKGVQNRRPSGFGPRRDVCLTAA